MPFSYLICRPPFRPVAAPPATRIGKILVIVQAGVAHPASVQADRVIEQRTVAVGSGLHLLEEVREQRYMERVDLGDLRDLLGIVTMMAGRMVRIRHSDLGIRAVAQLARELERDDPGDVRLECQNLQIEHELRVIGECRGNTDRTVHIGRRVVQCPGLGTLDLPLDLANALEVLIDANAIGVYPRAASAARYLR